MRTLFVMTCALAAGCVSQKIPPEVVSMAQSVRAGGEFVLEFAADGTVYAAEAEIPLDAVPAVCREAAKLHEPNGEPIGAEKEWAGGRAYWEVIVRSGGRRVELLMEANGALAGREDSLESGEYPAVVLESARRAVSGELVVVERVTGPEAQTGENYHVKIRDAAGEIQRVSVREDGSVVRVMRKMRAEVRAPR